MAEEQRILATKELVWEDLVADSPSGSDLPITVRVSALRNVSTSSFSNDEFGSSQFAIGDDVLIDVISKPSIITAFTNVGSIHSSFSVVENITDILPFSEENTASLSFVPHTNPSAIFLGHTSTNSGGITIKDTVVTLANKITGLLEVKYTITVKVYLLKGMVDPTFVSFINKDDNSSGIIIGAANKDSSDTTSTPFLSVKSPCDITSQSVKNVNIILVDHINGLPLKGVAIQIDGVPKGNTGTDGRLNLGKLVKGQTYNVSASKNGYLLNTSDCLDNETFTL